MFRVVCRSFGQLRCTDSCLIDSTGCKYFTWAGKWREKKTGQDATLQLFLILITGITLQNFYWSLTPIKLTDGLKRECYRGALVPALSHEKSWESALNGQSLLELWVFYWPQGAASCYCHSIGCSTVTNTGDGGEHVMIVPYEIL